MNILFLNSSKTRGGNEMWTATIAEALADKNHKVFLAARSDIFDDRLAGKVEIVKLPFRHELDKATISGIKSIIKKHKIQIAVPTKRKDYFIAGRLGKRRGLAVVFRLGIIREVPKWDVFQRYVYRDLPDAIIVNAEAIKDVLVKSKMSKPEKINVIRNGRIFPDKVEIFDEFEIKKDKFVFGAAGRLGPQKGYDYLLKAADILNKQRIDFRIYVAGEGTSREEYEKFIETSKLQDVVFMPGEIRNVRGFFKEVDAVLIPSRNEGIPNVLLEAWSVGKPAIASRSAGIPEAIDNGENGILINLDAGELAEAMKKLIDNPELLFKFGEMGRKTLGEKFRYEDMVASVENLFYAMIKEKD